MFPEIDYDKIDKIRGLDIVITTSANTDDEGRALLAAFNFRSASEVIEMAKTSMVQREIKRKNRCTFCC